MTHGFLLRDGAYTTMDYPDAVATMITDVNDDGVIVGYFRDAAGATHGFVYKKQVVATGPE